MLPLKVIGISFLPADSISACDLLLTVKTRATFAKIHLIKVFFKYHSLASLKKEVVTSSESMQEWKFNVNIRSCNCFMKNIMNYYVVLLFVTFKVQWVELVSDLIQQ